MKKIFYLFAAITLCVFASCSKDEIIPTVSFPVGTTDYFKSSIDFDANESEQTITFTSNVPWKATVDETRDGSTWCTVSPSSGEAGQASLKISASKNTTYDDRNAVVRLTYGDSVKTIFVNQKQLDALTLTSDRFDVPVSGGYIDVEVKANVNYTVNIPEEYKSWIAQTTAQSTRSLQSSALRFYISPSEEYEQREGTIEIVSGDKCEKVMVYQSGEGVLTLTKKNYSLSSSEQDITIQVKSNFEYEVEMPQVDWITEGTTLQTRSISTHTIKLHIAANETYDGRSAVLRIYDKNSSLTEDVTINQSQLNAIQIEQREYEFDEKGGEFTVNLESNVDYEVQIGDGWVSENTMSTRGLVSHSHRFIVGEMKDGSSRETKITFTDKNSGVTDEVTIKQTNTLVLSSTSISMMVNTSKQLTCSNCTEQNLVWESSDPTVVTVDNAGNMNALKNGSATITVKTEDGMHEASCKVTVKTITDCISMSRTGTSMTVSSSGTKYSVTFTIRNTSSETIHLVTLGGASIDDDLSGNSSVSYTLSSPYSAIQAFQVDLVYTFNGKKYTLAG